MIHCWIKSSTGLQGDRLLILSIKILAKKKKTTPTESLKEQGKTAAIKAIPSGLTTIWNVATTIVTPTETVPKTWTQQPLAPKYPISKNCCIMKTSRREVVLFLQDQI